MDQNNIRLKETWKYNFITQLDEKSLSENIILYPNPAKENISITLGNSFTKNQITISCYDLMGKEIIATKNISNKFNLDTSTLSKGIYFLKIQSAENYAIKKFIKQ